jgi:hypothetical protein
MTGQNSNTCKQFYFDPNHAALVPFYIAQDLELNASQLRIYIFIVGLKFRMQNVYITNKMLCEQLGIKEESKMLQKYMRGLKEKGYLSRDKKIITQPDGKQVEVWCWDVGHPVCMPVSNQKLDKKTNDLSTEKSEGGVPEGHGGGVPEGHPNRYINKNKDKEISKVLKNKKNNEYSSEFLEFWETTNKKGSKWNAYKAWRSLKLDKRLEELKDLWNVYFKNDFKNRDYNFIPNISTWLNSHPWDNEKIPSLPSQANTSKTQNKAPTSNYPATVEQEERYRLNKQLQATKDALIYRDIQNKVHTEKSQNEIKKMFEKLRGKFL